MHLINSNIGILSGCKQCVCCRYVLEDVSSDSLVLVDELGKGTEAAAGAALAGSMLEALDASRCRGIFAT